MIYAHGFLKPTGDQLVQLRRNADNSFCAISNLDFVKQRFPAFEGWENATNTVLMLRLKNVEPHDDPWVSDGREPKVRRAIFWLMEGGKSYSGQGVFFGCGRAVKHIKPGEFVVFSDAVTHWVMSDRIWRGCAIQLRKCK